MKLSLDNKRGFIKVRSGLFVKVSKTHKVSGATLSSAETDTIAAKEDTFAEPGDLAVEIINTKLKKRIGYAYLAGAAIRLNSYEADPGWFEPAAVKVIELRDPGSVEGETNEEFIKWLVGELMAVKYDHDVGLVKYRHNEFTDVAAELARLYGGYHPADGQPPRGHLFGEVYRSKRFGVRFHFEPIATEHGASQFQISLAVSQLR